MTVKIKQKGTLGSVAEDLFVELFCDTFGPDKSEFLPQYPFTDIYPAFPKKCNEEFC